MKGVKQTINEFIIRAHDAHHYKYNYSLANYKNNYSKIEIICPIHGSWFQTPSNHLSGKGCKKCANVLQINDTEYFIQKAKLLHHNKYDYSYIKYIRADIAVKIVCPIHGIFSQTPDAHLHSKGCFQCGRDSCGKSRVNNTLYFISKANITHNYKYDYSKTIYLNNRKKVIIICSTHGEFSQLAMSHLAGKGCKICATSISNKETKWLDSLGISTENRNKSIRIYDSWIKPDGFDPLTNTIYEFYGDFWHGNPKIYNKHNINLASKIKFGILYDNTIKRENLIKSAGYKIISIWENEFDGN